MSSVWCDLKTKQIKEHQQTTQTTTTKVLTEVVFSGSFSFPHSLCSFTIYIWLCGAEQPICEERWILGVLFLFSQFLVLKEFWEVGWQPSCETQSVHPCSLWDVGRAYRVLAGRTLGPCTVIPTFFLFRRRERVPQRKIKESPICLFYLSSYRDNLVCRWYCIVWKEAVRGTHY